jgi:hypothetical protein
VDVSICRFGRAFSVGVRRFRVVFESAAGVTTAAGVCELTAISPVGAA